MAYVYDPVKAHEYYMKHRKLKGRKKKAKSTKKGGKAKKQNRLSLANVNESGVAAANTAKAQVNSEKKDFNKKLSTILTNKVKALKQQLANATPEEREKAVQELKDKYAEIKKQANAYFKERYAQEVDKIKADGKYKK